MNADEAQDLRIEHPIHLSLQRRPLILGCEPEAAAILFGLCALLIFVTMSVPTVIIGVALLILGIPTLQRMAKHDPFMIRILLRHFEYQNEYAAWPSLAMPPQTPRRQQGK